MFNKEKKLYTENEVNLSKILHPIIAVIAQEGYEWQPIAPVIITRGGQYSRNYGQSRSPYSAETVHSSEVRIAKPIGFDEDQLATLNVRQHVDIGDPIIYQAAIQRETNSNGSYIGAVMQIGRDDVNYCAKPADRNAVIMHLYLELLQRGLDLSSL